MSKSKIFAAVWQVSVQVSPSFTTSELLEVYCELNHLDASSPTLLNKVDASITAKGHASPNSIKHTLAREAREAIKDAGKTTADLPLKANGSMTDDDFKVLGRETLLVGPPFTLMFKTLSTLVQLHSASTTPADGYFSFHLVVWFLVQLAVDKKLVRSLGISVLFLDC